MIAIIGLFLSLVLFIFLSFKGWNIAVSSVLAGLLLLITNGMSLTEGFTEIFASGFGEFASSWWMMFALGALFGKVMQECGVAGSIVNLMSKKLHGNAIWIIMFISFVMSYGGIGTFVIAFTIYPIASELFSREGICTSLLPAVMLFCPTTVAMTMLPGTPSVQNILPTKYLNTDIYAAPLLGLIASTVTLLLGSLYLHNISKKMKVSDEMRIIDKNLKYTPKDWLSFLPCICLWVISFVMIRIGFDSQISVEAAMTVGILICITIGHGKCDIRKVVNTGFLSGLETLAMTSCIMGYGAIVKNSLAFSIISDALFGASENPLISSVIAINLIAAITGSSTSGMQLFFDSFAQEIVSVSLPHDVFHRVIAIASGGLDSMPYATGVAIANKLSATELSKTYLHIFVTCAAIPLIALVVVIAVIQVIY